MTADDRIRKLESENAQLREHLAESESVLDAIQRGEIDAVVVSRAGEPRVFTLQSADHPYRRLVETMGEGAATLSGSGVILYANPRLVELLDSSSTTLAGMRLTEWAAESDRERVAGMIEMSSAAAVSDEVTLTAANGTDLPVRISFSTLEIQGDRYVSAIITDQRLARHHAALAEAAEQTREANDRLRDADQRKDVFLATLAHELRNPLAPIRAAADVLHRLNTHDDKQRKACKIIERQVTHMTRLVDDLLEVSRITLGRIQLQKRQDNLANILSGVVESIRSSTKLDRVLTLEVGNESLDLDGDTVRLSQAVSNVIENAIKYTTAGGTIDVQLIRDGADGIVRIVDNGIGISPDALPQIFEMFTQEDRGDRRSNSGLGIGLALTRNIVELHGGTIHGSSPGVGRGSEFVIRLPLKERRASPTEERVDSPNILCSQDILIVDDNVDAADSLCIALALTGHTTKAVYRGSAALDTIESSRPDIVLLDIGLPDIDGYEVARRMRKRLGTACPKVIALSGWGRDQDKMRATEAGFDAYLTKPVSPEALTRVIAAQFAGPAE